MKKLFFFFVALSVSQAAFPQTNSLKFDGEYCDRAGVIEFCMSFKGDTFHYGVLSMMFNYVGKGTYTVNDKQLTLNFCRADSSRYVDGTIPAGTVKQYEIKKHEPEIIILQNNQDKDTFTLKRSK